MDVMHGIVLVNICFIINIIIKQINIILDENETCLTI